MTPIPASDRRLTLFSLAAARVTLLVLAAVTVGLCLAGMPLKLAELRQVCTNSAQCSAWRLNSAEAARLLAAGLSLDFYAGYRVVTRLAVALLSWSLALLILLRRPSERMPLLTALFLIIFPANVTGFLQALPPVFPALWFPVQALQYIAWPLFPIFFLLFPNGHWVPRLRYVGWFLAVWCLAFIPGYFFPNAPIAKLPDSLWFIFFPAMFGLCLFAQVYRYRRVSTALERQQTKWVVYGVTLLLSGVSVGGVAFGLLAPSISLATPLAPADFLVDFIFNVLLFSILPVTLAVSILRYRLFEIDVLIRRTLVYAVLTGLLALAYFGSIVVLQNTFGVLTGRSQSTLVTVLSTLVIAALFVPLRARVQAVIDQRLYRSKYDAARTLAIFGATLRDEVEMGTLSEHLLDVVDQTMQPEQVSLWLRPNPSGLAALPPVQGKEQY